MHYVWCQFPHSSDLKKCTHTREKPYKCDMCHAKFAQSGALKRHIRTHAGEKPYTCDMCGAQFPHSSDLNKHTRTRNGEQPYKCDRCRTPFEQSGYWGKTL